jgi:hypothetical protein
VLLVGLIKCALDRMKMLVAGGIRRIRYSSSRRKRRRRRS